MKNTEVGYEIPNNFQPKYNNIYSRTENIYEDINNQPKTKECVTSKFKSGTSIDWKRFVIITSVGLFSICFGFLVGYFTTNANIKENVCSLAIRIINQSLIDAASKGETDTVKLLLLCGEDPNQTEDFYTPLLWAAEIGANEVVELLLKFNANVNAVNNYNETALTIAINRGHTNIAEQLLHTHVNSQPFAKTAITKKPMLLQNKYEPVHSRDASIIDVDNYDPVHSTDASITGVYNYKKVYTGDVDNELGLGSGTDEETEEGE